MLKNRGESRGDIDLHGMMNRGTRGVGPIDRGVGRGRRRGRRPWGPFRVFPTPWPVLVVRMFLHVYDPQSLGFLHVRPSVLRGQPSPFLPWNTRGPSVSWCRNGATIFRYDIATLAVGIYWNDAYHRCSWIQGAAWKAIKIVWIMLHADVYDKREGERVWRLLLLFSRYLRGLNFWAIGCSIFFFAVVVV